MRPNRLVTAVAGILMVLGALAAAAFPAAASGSRHAAAHADVKAKPSTEAFGQAMRKLWEDHITWTRLFIVSVDADLPDTEATDGPAPPQPDRHRRRDQAVLRRRSRNPADRPPAAITF